MSARTLQIAAVILCGILLLMAGAVPAFAAPEAPPSPEPAAVAGPEAIDAAPAMLLSYQGTLRTSSGSPDNGSHTIIAAIYDNSAGTGTALWGPETHSNVQVRDGHFSLLLGNGSPAVTIPANLFSVATRYLKLTVDGNALTPGQRLAAVPYAVSANYANSLAAPDGDPLAAVTVSDGGDLTVPTYALSFGSTTRQMVNLWGTGYGIGVQGYTQYFRSDSNFAWYMDGTHSDTALDPGTGGTAATVLAGGKLGIGTTNPGSRLHVETTTGSNVAIVKSAADAVAGVEYQSNGNAWQLSKRASGEGDELRFYYHNGTSWQSPAVRVKPDGSVNVHDDLTVGTDQHKPIFFRTYQSTRHWSFHVTTTFSANDWTCGIVSFKVSTNIRAGTWRDPLIRVEAIEEGGVWHFYFDTADQSPDDKRENWTATVMCVDNRLAEQKSTCVMPAGDSATLTCP